MIFRLSIYLFIIFQNFFHNSAMEMNPQDHCDVAEDKTIVEWFSHINNFINNNKDLSQNLQQINKKLDLCVKEQQQQPQFSQNQIDQKSMQLEKINQLERQLQELQQKTNENVKEIYDLRKQFQQLQQQKTNGTIVIQRRQDGTVDFYRNWDEYKHGFGNETAEFFIGLEKLHKLTNSRPYELLIVMEDWENDRRYAKYDQFIVGSESENFILKSIGTYSGSAGDSLTRHVGQKFSTKDKDQDTAGENCAIVYKGAWWYDACHVSNLNGQYLKGTHTEYALSVIWHTFKGYHYSLKFVEMILVPK